MHRELIEQRLENFSQEVERLRSSRPSRRLRYPQSIREEALALIKVGVSVQELKRRAGLTPEAVQKWVPSEGFRAVKVVKARSADGREVIMKSPLGWEICGLSIEDVQAFFEGHSLS